ncbi:hypothetical protein LCGC14_2485800, partial [marine sediment metagenome]
SGSTYINAPTGQLIHLHINDIMKMSLSVAGLTMGIPIAMGTNKITGLGDPAAAQDATTKIYVDAALMIGSANAEWIPCAYMDSAIVDTWRVSNVGTLDNLGATNTSITFTLPLPTNRGGKKLYINGYSIGIFAADADDYVNNSFLKMSKFDTVTTIPNSLVTTNRTAQGEFDTTFAAVDVSGFNQIYLILEVVNTNANQLRITNVAIRCYYDT